MKRLNYTLAFLVLLSPAALNLSGCAAHRTTRTEIVQEEPRARYSDEGTVVKEETTVESTSSGGGGLFEIIGEIIALPFRAVGALLSAIF